MRRQKAEEDAEFLLDILLSSVNPEKVDDNLGWKIAENIRDEKLFTSEIKKLLYRAAKQCEPEKLRRINHEGEL